MAVKKDKKLDSIFEPTKAKKTAKKETSQKTKVKTADNGAGNGGGFNIDKFKVLNTLLKNHEAEALYRKRKEDRLLATGLGLIVLIAIGAFLIRAMCAGYSGNGWFYSLIFRSFFAVMIGVTGFSAAAMIELNRTRLQDILALIVKIQEKFGLFKSGEYDEDALLPSPYKFIGSINDDETNYALLMLKAGAFIAAVAVFLLV
jgi:hypothetical protein